MKKRPRPNRHPGIPAPFRKPFPALLLAATLSAALTLLPGPAPALELGLTPSQVFGLWTNINKAVLVSAETAIPDPALRDQVKKIEAEPSAGKTPADVLAKAHEFHEQLSLLRLRSGLKAKHTLFTAAGEATPSDVFIHSKHVLNELSEWLAVNTGPETLIAPLYGRHQFSGKTPSDVFALADLANRRMKAILRLARIG